MLNNQLFVRDTVIQHNNYIFNIAQWHSIMYHAVTEYVFYRLAAGLNSVIYLLILGKMLQQIANWYKT